MKLLMILIITLGPLTTLAKGRTSYHGTYSINGETEQSVISKAQGLMPAIMNMEVKKISREGRFRGCSFRTNYKNSTYKFNVKGVSVTKLYKVDNNQVIKPYYRASIRYIFGSCREGR